MIKTWEHIGDNDEFIQSAAIVSDGDYIELSFYTADWKRPRHPTGKVDFGFHSNSEGRLQFNQFLDELKTAGNNIFDMDQLVHHSPKKKQSSDAFLDPYADVGDEDLLARYLGREAAGALPYSDTDNIKAEILRRMKEDTPFAAGTSKPATWLDDPDNRELWDNVDNPDYVPKKPSMWNTQKFDGTIGDYLAGNPEDTP